MELIQNNQIFRCLHNQKTYLHAHVYKAYVGIIIYRRRIMHSSIIQKTINIKMCRSIRGLKTVYVKPSSYKK